MKNLSKILLTLLAVAFMSGCKTDSVKSGNPGAAAFYKALGMAPQYTSMELLL